ncbi:YybH family protein [Hyphococcus luteus]|nr:nuclear transport factor 2 family protein [Marinicaulis flavus]
MKRFAFGFAFIALCAASPALAGPVEDMMAADRAFADMAKAEGVPAAFAAYAAEDVRMFPEGVQPYAGRDALIERFSAWPDGAHLSWAPVEGMASGSGDFGFTWGRFVYTAEGDAGPVEQHGKYVSVWRKTADGDWKFVADIGNTNPAPEAEKKP